MTDKVEFSTPKFSLILATINRQDDVEILLTSLAAQEFMDFEVILVDQNLDGRLDKIVTNFSTKIKIQRILSEPGLSRARNNGLKLATGELVAFPDDDCFYPPWLLTEVAKLFLKNPGIDGVAGRTIGLQDQAFYRGWPLVPLTPINVWQKAISYTIFLQKQLVDRVGLFDESLGVGAGTPWGSGEETDFLLRSMAAGAKLVHQGGLVVHHPDKALDRTNDEIARSARYARGTGRVLRKNIDLIGPGGVAYSVLRSCGGIMASLCRADWFSVKVFSTRLYGKVTGLLAER